MQVVNLLVTPEQAEKLSLAANQTTIQLVLRNPLDHDVAKTPGTALAPCWRWQAASAGCRRGHTTPVVRSRASAGGGASGG